MSKMSLALHTLQFISVYNVASTAYVEIFAGQKFWQKFSSGENFHVFGTTSRILEFFLCATLGSCWSAL